ncbi:MAG: hypothetical protein H7145_07065 [Akkermansiaceae bacterium]|nr:hypothetical protein [Armatimonadota bacterium]
MAWSASPGYHASMNPPEMSNAPVPELLRLPGGSSLSRNSWRQLVNTVPVQAERIRYNTTSPTSLPPAVRFPLCAGILQFADTGIFLDGQAVVGNAPLTRIAGTVHFVFFLLYVVCSGGLLFGALKPYKGWGIFFMFGGILIQGISRLVQERQRVAMAVKIPWCDVHGAQIDTNGRWITLFFDMPIPGASRQSVFLSLNGLDSATIAAISETMGHHNPGSRFATVKAYEWTRGRKIAFSILGIPVVLLIFVVFVAVWRRFFP